MTMRGTPLHVFFLKIEEYVSMVVVLYIGNSLYLIVPWSFYLGNAYRCNNSIPSGAMRMFLQWPASTRIIILVRAGVMK